MMKAVIMAGGQGTRFWPLSTKRMPKQFLNLYSGDSLLQQTYQRFQTFLPNEKIYILTTKQYLPIVQEQLPKLNMEQIIVEYDQRDTAPCIALTGLFFLNQQDDEVLVIAPSDHYIEDIKSFHEALTLAETMAEQDHSIVTLGVLPTAPKTGYGYIQILENSVSSQGVFKVEKFIEKPDIKKAEELLDQKNVYWNSGIFIWRPTTIAYHFKKLQPDIWNILNENIFDLKTIYASLPKISVDYAILEKAENVYLVPSFFTWDDIGTWSSLERFKKVENKDIKGKVMTDSANNCLVYTDRTTLLLGVEDLIVASTDEGILVCHKSEEQKVKKLINDGNLMKNDSSDQDDKTTRGGKQ
jgi:mannose-1-phosphate guanylyltransferase